MKRICTLLIVASIMLSLCACGGSGEEATPVPTASSGQPDDLREDAIYRNGLYFLTTEIENEEATVRILNDFICFDGKVTGNIEVTENADCEWEGMLDGQEEMDAYLNDLQNKYVFTWADGTSEYPIDTFNKNHWGTTSQDSVVSEVRYGIDLDEPVQSGTEDVLVSIYITNFEKPLQFIIPAEGTAPEYGILYGTFSPGDIIYLSPRISDDSQAFLDAAGDIVFSVSKGVFAVYDTSDDGVIQEGTYSLYSKGTDMDDMTYGSVTFAQLPEIDISGYASKTIYLTSSLTAGRDPGYYAVMLMDEETWIGHWSSVETESDGNRDECDYIFKVENAVT